MKKILALFAATFILSGCSILNQSSLIENDYFQETGPGKLHSVVFAGPDYMSEETVKMFTLYRCAQLAQSRNKPFFILYSTLEDAIRQRPSASARTGSVWGNATGAAFVLLLEGPSPRSGVRDTSATLEELEKAIATSKFNYLVNVQKK